MKQSQQPQPHSIRRPPAPSSALVSAAPMRSDNNQVINITGNESEEGQLGPQQRSTATIQSENPSHGDDGPDSLNSGTDRIEIGSAHTSSSMDSTALRAYWDELVGVSDSWVRSDTN